MPRVLYGSFSNFIIIHLLAMNFIISNDKVWNNFENDTDIVRQSVWTLVEMFREYICTNYD